ncbi:PAS domain-containing protein [Aestuariispira insulae]|nr:PAS domain-containing protein [Aestuariispira insulae]
MKRYLISLVGLMFLFAALVLGVSAWQAIQHINQRAAENTFRMMDVVLDRELNWLAAQSFADGMADDRLKVFLAGEDGNLIQSADGAPDINSEFQLQIRSILARDTLAPRSRSAGFVALEGRLYLYALHLEYAKPDAVVILLRPLDEAYLAALSKRYSLPGLDLTTSATIPEQARYLITDPIGTVIASLSWDPPSPASSLIGEIAVFSGILSAICLFPLAYLINRLKNHALNYQNQAEVLLGQSREIAKFRANLQSVLDGLPDGVIAIDDQLQIAYFNRTAASLTGLSRDLVVGLPADWLEQEMKLAEFNAGYQSLATILNRSDNGSRQQEVWASLKNSKRSLLAFTTTPCRINADLSTIISFRDITNRRRSDRMLDLLSASFIMLDQDCRVLHLNDGARRLVNHSELLQIQGGVLTSRQEQEATLLKQTVRQVIKEARNDRQTHTQGILLSSSPGGDPMAGLITSMATRSQDGQIFALLTLGDRRSLGSRMDPALLADMLGLTEAESKVATLLIQGHRPAEIAGILGTSPNTVRNQIKSVFAKTNCPGQVEFISMVLSSLPPALITTDRDSGTVPVRDSSLH